MINEFSKLIILNRRLEPISDLENAFALVEDERINAISHMQFSLPFNDPKNRYCEPFNYVRNPGGELYRIMMDSKTIAETGDWEYRVEHILTTLADKTIQRPIALGGVGANGTTAAVIRRLLDMQDVRNWVLGECDFNFNFEYGFLGESLLAAILDIPHHFVAPFQWTFDTSRYPFVLNLKRLEPNIDPEIYIEPSKNRIKAVRHRDQTTVCTRLYPYGYGEYPNRLTVESVNSGVEFLQSPPEIFNRYPNAIERTFVDRRIQNPQSLLEIGQAILNEAQVPFEEYEVELTELSGDPFSAPALGKLAEMVGFKRAFITGIKWEYKETPKCTVMLANRPRNIADEVLQLRNRVRIESTYAQGVTQFWQAHDKGNATPQRAFWLPMFIPGSMRIVNFVTLHVEVSPFAIEVANRTSNQPNIAQTGNMTRAHNTGLHNIGLNFIAPSLSTGTPPSLNGSAPTISGGGSHTHTFTGVTTGAHDHRINNNEIPQHAHNFSHTHTVSGNATGAASPGSTSATLMALSPGSFSTQIGSAGIPAGNIGSGGTAPTISGGTYTLNAGAFPSINSGSASLTNNNHSHALTDHQHIFPHTHLLEPGITTTGNPTAFTLRINGQNRQTVQGRTLQRDIRQFMTGTDGTINTNFMHRIEVLPNAPAYVSITLFVQGFLMAERELVL